MNMNPVFEIENISKKDIKKIENFLTQNNIKYEKFNSIIDTSLHHTVEIALVIYYVRNYSKYTDEKQIKFVNDNINFVIKQFENDGLLWSLEDRDMNEKVSEIMDKKRKDEINEKNN